MYRISDDLYIDTSLIDCASYQLFLDDMYAQNKAYQPDHWSNYHRPVGSANTPVLGVRYSDALEFCKWLNRYHATEWQYRLPTFNEGILYSLSTNLEQPLGYWVGNENDIKFLEVSSNSDIAHLPDEYTQLANDIPCEVKSKAYINLAHDLEFNQQLTSDLELDLDLHRTHPQIRNLDRACTRLYELVRVVKLADMKEYSHNIGYIMAILVFLLSLFGAFYLFTPLYQGITEYQKSNSDPVNQDVVKIQAVALLGFLAIVLPFITFSLSQQRLNQQIRIDDTRLANRLKLDNALRITLIRLHIEDPSLVRAKAILHSLLWDLIILRLRCEGKLPACEGIRIIKERKT